MSQQKGNQPKSTNYPNLNPRYMEQESSDGEQRASVKVWLWFWSYGLGLSHLWQIYYIILLHHIPPELNCNNIFVANRNFDSALIPTCIVKSHTFNFTHTRKNRSRKKEKRFYFFHKSRQLRSCLKSIEFFSKFFNSLEVSYSICVLLYILVNQTIT